MKGHIERILCPKCGTGQNAIVEHTVPYYSYVHTCEHCGYVITESEWNEVFNLNALRWQDIMAIHDIIEHTARQDAEGCCRPVKEFYEEVLQKIQRERKWKQLQH